MNSVEAEKGAVRSCFTSCSKEHRDYFVQDALFSLCKFSILLVELYSVSEGHTVFVHLCRLRS